MQESPLAALVRGLVANVLEPRVLENDNIKRLIRRAIALAANNQRTVDQRVVDIAVHLAVTLSSYGTQLDGWREQRDGFVTDLAALLERQSALVTQVTQLLENRLLELTSGELTAREQQIIDAALLTAAGFIAARVSEADDAIFTESTWDLMRWATTELGVTADTSLETLATGLKLND